MGGSTTQRKAWNEAMRNAAGGALTTSARTKYRSSDRQKKQTRRERARKSSTLFSGESGADAREYRNAIRLDALEGVVGNDELDDVEEEYDELDDVNGDGGVVGGRKRKGGKKKTVVGIPKRFKPRSLASVLIEEASWRKLGKARGYLDAEALPRKDASGEILYPPRKFCPVTGLEGLYTDPKSGVPYANLTALEQIRERVPPWMGASTGGGTASYFEAVKSLKSEE